LDATALAAGAAFFAAFRAGALLADFAFLAF
jgi:hypothetical protein